MVSLILKEAFLFDIYDSFVEAFHGVFQKAIERAAPADSLPGRVQSLTDSITFSVFQYTARGLFERDKLTFSAQLTFQILLMNKEINPAELDFLLRYPAQPGVTSPVEFLSDHSWGGIKIVSRLTSKMSQQLFAALAAPECTQ
ncbi:hypothetical protein Nmel_016110 [Mimus melanotis]